MVGKCFQGGRPGFQRLPNSVTHVKLEIRANPNHLLRSLTRKKGVVHSTINAIVKDAGWRSMKKRKVWCWARAPGCAWKNAPGPWSSTWSLHQRVTFISSQMRKNSQWTRSKRQERPLHVPGWAWRRGGHCIGSSLRQLGQEACAAYLLWSSRLYWAISLLVWYPKAEDPVLPVPTTSAQCARPSFRGWSKWCKAMGSRGSSNRTLHPLTWQSQRPRSSRTLKSLSGLAKCILHLPLIRRHWTMASGHTSRRWPAQGKAPTSRSWSAASILLGTILTETLCVKSVQPLEGAYRHVLMPRAQSLSK